MTIGFYSIGEASIAQVNRDVISASATMSFQGALSAGGKVGNIKATLSVAGSMQAVGTRAAQANATVTAGGSLQAAGTRAAQANATMAAGGSLRAAGGTLIGRLIREGEEDTVYTIRLTPFRFNR